MIYSFDIFDTVLTRRTFQASDLHLLVARDLIAAGVWSGTLVAWRDAREAAEREARAAADAEEITLDDIAAVLGQRHGATLPARAVALELQHELAETVGIAATLEQLRALRRDGRQICYTSDMYLPRAQILAMLAKAGAPAAPLFLSCELGRTKRSGRLFHSVAAHFGVAPGQIAHLGDHIDSDHKVPARLGLRTTWFQGALPTMLEMDVHRRLAGPAPLLAATLSGAMRAARLGAAAPPAGGHLARLGTQEGALLHIAFVLWLLRQLTALGSQQVAFLARDGYLSSKIYDVLRSTLAGALPPANYTYASRQSLHLPGWKRTTGAEDLAWIMAPAEAMTFAEWLFRLGLTRADLRALAPAQPPLPADDALFADCREACLRLLRSADFVALAAAKADAARAVAYDYLRAQLAPAPGRVALVDIGWNGRMQRSIVDILAPAEPGDIHGFYLGILRTPSGSYGSYKAWLFDLRDEARPYCASHFELFETLFAAPHATTYGYARDADGRAVPTLAPHDTLTGIRPELIAFQDNILAISAAVRCAQGELAEAERELRALCRHVVARMFRAPSTAQAMAFSDVAFSSDQTNLGKEKLIYRMTWTQQYRCLLDRHFKPSANHWREGQLALADAPMLRPVYRVYSMLRLWMRKELTLRDILRQIKYRHRR